MPLWKILVSVAGALFALTIIVFVVVCFRRQKVLADKRAANLQREVVAAELDGVELPESIKRGFQRKAKGAHDNFVLSEEAEEQINEEPVDLKQRVSGTRQRRQRQRTPVMYLEQRPSETKLIKEELSGDSEIGHPVVPEKNDWDATQRVNFLVQNLENAVVTKKAATPSDNDNLSADIREEKSFVGTSED